jgi:hypothetical protein
MKLENVSQMITILTVFDILKSLQMQKTAMCDALECAYIDKKDFELLV